MSVKSSTAANQRVTVNFLDPERIDTDNLVGFYFDGKKIYSFPGFLLHDAHTTMRDCVKILYCPYNDRVMFYKSDGSVILWNEEKNTSIILSGLASCPPHYADCYYDDNYYPALICGNKLHILKKDGTVETKNYLTEAYCCVYHYGRMFDVIIGDEYEFYWTVQGMTSYEGGTGHGGYMRVPMGAGFIKRMFSLGDRIVILREYGINVMRGLADTRNFVLDHGTIMLGEKLIENASICDGKKVWFCTKTYLYCYDGKTLTQKEHGYGAEDCTVNCINIVDARYVYLSVSVGRLNYLVRYDPSTGEFFRFAKNCRFICKTSKGLLTIGISNILGSIVENSSVKNEMTFKNLDLGDDKYKTIKRIVFNADPTVTLKVTLNGYTRTFEAGVYDNLSMTAKSFTFSISGQGAVNALNAELEVYK